MIMGSRIIAPEGFKSLQKDVDYHFLLSDGVNNRVRFVFFSKGKNGLSVQLITLGRIQFEEALEDGLLVEKSPDKYPPWLSNIQGISIQHLEEHRKSIKESYDQKVNRRYMAIAGLVERAEKVLMADNPYKEIAAHAKSQMPVQNPARLRLWFFTYLVFGRNKWALLPPLHASGKWSREDRDCEKKLGRPSRKGKKWGSHADKTMRSKCLEGFLRQKSQFKTQSRIYTDVLVKHFGCISVVKENGGHEFFHPEAKPFPTERQFWYAIKKQVPPRELALALKGRHGSRRVSGSEGSFAEMLTNLNQRVEFDGYYISENPAGLIEGSAQQGYCVLRVICDLSGAVVAIGFSEGSETMEAYRMALFCMAINKVKFFELFGFVLEPGEWTCEGLSGDIILDRGPGATFDCLPHINWLGAFELTPTFSGQSKATVESSHPRDKHPKEQPSHFLSDKNFISLARRELWQVIVDNTSSNGKDRMSDDMILAGVRPTPQGIWDYWDARGRNSAISMEFETAVRTFLTPTSVTITRDAVYLHKRKYRSEALIETGVFDRVARHGVIQATAYVLTMCVRHIWIEYEGVLYELDVVRSAKTVEGTIDLTLRELMALGQMRRDSDATLREEISATQQYYRDIFEQTTGETWAGGVRKLGRAPKNAAAKRDKADAARFAGKGL